MNITHDVAVAVLKNSDALKEAEARRKDAIKRNDTAAGLRAAKDIMRLESEISPMDFVSTYRG